MKDALASQEKRAADAYERDRKDRERRDRGRGGRRDHDSDGCRDRRSFRAGSQDGAGGGSGATRCPPAEVRLANSWTAQIPRSQDQVEPGPEWFEVHVPSFQNGLRLGQARGVFY